MVKNYQMQNYIQILDVVKVAKKHMKYKPNIEEKVNILRKS